MLNSECAVLTPIARDAEPETRSGIAELQSRGYKVVPIRGVPQVDIARSIIASRAMRAGFKETLWIDSDVVFDPDDVEKLRRHGLPFTCGLYVKKGRPEFAAKFLDESATVTLGSGGGLVELGYVGFGFTHVRAEVYATIAKSLPECEGQYDPADKLTPYFLPMVVPHEGKHHYLGEDIAFCHRARKAGFKIMADTTIHLGHVGRKVWTWKDLNAG